MKPAAVFGIWASLAALVVCGLLLPAVAAVIAGGPPQGYARIWVYREDEPYVSLDRPYVRFNGAIVAISDWAVPSIATWHPADITSPSNSVGSDENQFVEVGAAAGQQIYIEVQVLQYWACEGYGMHSHWCAPTFYTRLQSPQVGAAAIARSKFYGGG